METITRNVAQSFTWIESTVKIGISRSSGRGPHHMGRRAATPGRAIPMHCLTSPGVRAGQTEEPFSDRRAHRDTFEREGVGFVAHILGQGRSGAARVETAWSARGRHGMIE